jgi:outer membrane protein assembly factor BamB
MAIRLRFGSLFDGYVRGVQVIVGSADGKLYIFNKDTGARDAEYNIGSEIHASPIADERAIYVGSDNGYLLALEQGKDFHKVIYQPMPDGLNNYPVVDPASPLF